MIISGSCSVLGGISESGSFITEHFVVNCPAYVMTDTISEFPKKIFEQLQDVNCDLLGTRDQSWLSELVFSSSENHNQFLKWILCSFDDNLDDTFNSVSFQNLNTNDQQKQLHRICCSIGFCEEKDFNIINGTADKESVRTFWELLLDLHLIHMKTVDSGENGKLQLKNLSGICVLENSDLSDLTLNTKTTEVEMQKLSSPPSTWKLLPPDLEYEAREYAKTNSITTPTKQQVAAMLSKTEEHENRELKFDDTQDLHGQVVSSVKSLQEMIPEFTKCHQRLQPWLKENATKSGVSHLEDLIKTASEKMAELKKLLDDVQLESKYKDLSKTDLENLKPVDVHVDDNSHIIDTLNEAVNPRKRK